MTKSSTTQHKTGTRDEWLAARLKLLNEEKELTKRNDEVTQHRQELPWVRVEKEYVFDTDYGKASLADLFKGCSQLLVYHFMFGPEWKDGCPSCSMIADAFNGSVIHLNNHDIAFWAVSRAPLPKLQAYKQRMGWSFPWASSFGNDFNYDFSTSYTKEQQEEGIEYNFHREPELVWRAGEKGGGSDAENKLASMCGVDAPAYAQERPGMSAFALQEAAVYHTYSTYARGVDPFFGVYHWLDRAPMGRNETGVWWHRHDEYGK